MFHNCKSHILDSNGVWYSSFWSEGPKNHRNLKILVSKFVPRGFEAQRTWGFEAQHHGVSRGSNTDKTLQWFIILRCPSRSHLITRDLEAQRKMINHWSLLLVALPLETPWRCPSKPLRRPSKPHGAVPRNPRCAAPQNPWGQILRPKFSSFGGF